MVSPFFKNAEINESFQKIENEGDKKREEFTGDTTAVTASTIDFD